MEIVNLGEKDLEALAGLFKQFWGESSEIDKMKEMFEWMSNHQDYVLLGAKKDDVLLGFCMGVICQSLYGDCNPFMVIEDFIVDKQHRRTGVGTALMSAAEQKAMQQECYQVIFVTENDRKDAQRFYTSQGYSAATHKGFKKRLSVQ